MEVKLFFALVLFILVGSHDAADMDPSRSTPDLLQQAIKYLVNYTASEAKTRLDMNNIGSTVAAIAYQELTEKLSKYKYIYLMVNTSISIVHFLLPIVSVCISFLRSSDISKAL